MTNRILLNTSGLKISKPGVDVLTTNNANLYFDSNGNSYPILIKSSVALSTSYNTTVTLYYGKTFTSVPYSSIWHSTDDPTTATSFRCVSSFSNLTSYVKPLSYDAAHTDWTIFFAYRYTDRIEFISRRNHSSGSSSSYPLSGYCTAVVYDYS